jgi:hypothetical protein
VETYLQLDERGTAEYERLRELAVNQEVKVMEMTWEERMEVKYTQKGRLDAMRQILLRLLDRRFGAVPEAVRLKVEAINDSAPLSDLTEKVLDAQSIEELGLS